MLCAEYGRFWYGHVQGVAAQMIGLLMVLMSSYGLVAIFWRLWPWLHPHLGGLALYLAIYVLCAALPLLVCFEMLPYPYDLVVSASSMVGVFAVGHLLHEQIKRWDS